MKALIKNRLLFLMAFGVSKAIVFLAPLLLSNTLTKVDYGILEYALNIGFIGAAILNLGVPNAYPYFKLKRNFKTIYDGFNFHYLFLLVSSALVLGIVLVFKNNIQTVLSVLFVYTLSNQSVYSLISKTDEKIIQAVILDSLFYVILLGAYIYILMTGDTSINGILYFSVLYCLVYVFFSIKGCSKTIFDSYKKHQKLIKYGKSVMLSGIFILLIANSGRILIDYVFKDKELIAIYGFYFRMASFVVIIHQVLSIIYFKKIYTFNVHKLDTYFVLFLGLLVVGGVLTYVTIPRIGGYFFKLFETYPIYKKSYLILNFQMLFWIILATNENVVYRENLANKMNIAFTMLLFVFATIVWFIKDLLSFTDAVLVLYLLICTAVFIQFFILYRFKKIRLPKTVLASAIIFFLSLILLV